MKRPAVPLYTESWFSDPFTRSLSLSDRMVYMELLLLSWQENGISADLIANPRPLTMLLGRGVGIRTFQAAWARVSCKFLLGSDGAWRNQRVEKERARMEQYRDKQSNNAKSNGQRRRLAEHSDLSLFSSTLEDQSFSAEDDPVDPKDRPVVDLLNELNEARLRFEGTKTLRPLEANLKHIRDRLADGHTPEEIRHVIAVCAEESRRRPEAEQWFNAITPFRPENFQRKLAMTIRSVSRPATLPNGAPVREPPRYSTIEETRRKNDAEHADSRRIILEGLRAEGVEVPEK